MLSTLTIKILALNNFLDPINHGASARNIAQPSRLGHPQAGLILFFPLRRKGHGPAARRFILVDGAGPVTSQGRTEKFRRHVRRGRNLHCDVLALGKRHDRALTCRHAVGPGPGPLPEGRKNHGQRKAPGMGQGSHKKIRIAHCEGSIARTQQGLSFFGQLATNDGAATGIKIQVGATGAIAQGITSAGILLARHVHHTAQAVIIILRTAR